MVNLSASKISTYLTCSYKAWCRYHLNFPNVSNNGQKLGSATHEVIECITHPRRLKFHETQAASMEYLYSPSVQRLIRRLLKKHDALSDPNVEKIEGFITVAIKNNLIRKEYINFYRELPFEVKTDVFRLTGKIDQVFFYPDKAIVVDFKSSKSKPVGCGKEDYFNIQGLTYEWAVRRLFGYDTVEVEFHYLKFKKACVVKSPPSKPELLDGFEDWLEYIAKYIKNFNFQDAISNLAYSNGNRFSAGGCGGCLGQTTAAGEEWYMCEMKYPREFYVLKDDKGKVVKSAFFKKELLNAVKDGYNIERREHAGCPAFKKLFE